MKKCETWLAIGAAIPIFAIVAWMLLDNACTLSNSLGVSESANQCYSRWISALSGWAAAIAAIVTIIYLRGTLETAQTQAEQAARQTAIMSGEVAPRFNYETPNSNEGGNLQRFVFVNESKYVVHVRSIRVSEPATARFSIIGRNRHLGLKKDWPAGSEHAVKTFDVNFKLKPGHGSNERVQQALNMAFYRDGEDYFGEIRLIAAFTIDAFGPNDVREMICDEILIAP